MRILQQNTNFINRTKLDEALKESFIAIDKFMITKEGIRRLFSFRDSSKGSTEGGELS